MNEVKTGKSAENKGGNDPKQIDINFPALINLLSHHLYKDKSAVLRELLSNANDALIARNRESGFKGEKPMIRLWLDHGTARLIVKDNGIGMSSTDLIDYLSTIGSSLTQEQREKHQDEKTFLDESIGRFGVGFLSSFIVANEIIVETRKPEHPGYRWQSKGERSYTITELPDIDCGSVVYLRLKAKIREEWDDDIIKRLVLENARNFVFPIYWGPTGEEKLNDLQAPWYEEETADEEKYRKFLVKYGGQFASAENATEVIPLYSEDIRGVVYFPAGAAIQHEKVGVIDLYCKRVFVTKDHSEIVPQEFSVIKGIVDCFRFKLNLARDNVQQDNVIFKQVREFIGTQIMEHFRHLALQAKESNKEKSEKEKPGKFDIHGMRLQTIIDEYHPVIKNALVQKVNEKEYRYADHYLNDFEDFMPFQSSMEPTTTIPAYLKRISGTKEKEVLFLQPDENLIALQNIAQQKKHEFIVIRHPVEEEYLNRYCEIIGITCKSALDVMSAESFPKLPVTTAGWKQIITYYQERLDHPEFSLSVYLSEFQPATVYGRLLVDRESEWFKKSATMIAEIRKLLKQMEKEEKSVKEDNPLYKELEKLERKRAHTLYLNKDNPVLEKLANMLAEGLDINLDTILHPIFHDVAVAAGHQVPEGHLTEYQTKAYGDLLAGISAQNENKESKKMLRKLESDYSTAQDRIKTIENNLKEAQDEADSLRQKVKSDGKEDSEITNKVFFIRSMLPQYDYISKHIGEVCNKLGLEFVDPKEIKLPGDIFKDIVDNLRTSRFVIADVTEVKNPNVYYEVGYVQGSFSKKIILVADEKVIEARELPFDVIRDRVKGYGPTHEKFSNFLADLEKTLRVMKDRKD